MKPSITNCNSNDELLQLVITKGMFQATTAGVDGSSFLIRQFPHLTAKLADSPGHDETINSHVTAERQCFLKPELPTGTWLFEI